MQGRRGRNQSRYAAQLSEKQNLKDIYGIREQQLKRYYKKAQAAKEETGPALIALLERRLDNAIYRAGMAETRKQARQMASHKLFSVNGRTVDVPSIQLGAGDVVQLRESKREKSLFANLEKRLQAVQMPNWLQADVKGFGFKVTGMPSAEEAQIGVGVQDVVEFLSR